MKKLTFQLIVVIFLFSCTENSKSKSSILKDAISDYNNGKFISCQAKLLDYTQKYPQDYQGWSLLGTVALQLDNDSLARKGYNKSISLNPKDHKALTGLGILSRKSKEYDKAADFYRKAISIDPTYAKAYSSLLIVEIKNGNYATAVELGEKAINLDPNDLGIKGNLSVAYHFNNQISKRDSLLKILSNKEYRYVEILKLAFENKASIEDL